MVAAISAPVLARLFGPAEFGAFAAYSALAVLVGGFACLQYDLAVMLPKAHASAAPVFLLAVSLAALVAVGSGLVILMIQYLEFGDYFGGLVFWLPASVLISGTLSAASYWASRTRNFQELAASKIAHQVVNATTGIGSALAGAGSAAALVAANVIGQLSALLFLGSTSLKQSRRDLRAGCNMQMIRVAAFDYRKFPQYSLWANLLNNASWQAPVLVLGFLFSTAAVGFYAVALRIIQIPMGLISTSVSQVYLQRMTEDPDPQKRVMVTEAVFARLLSISILPCACLSISGKEIFIVLLGAAWAEAGELAQILAPWALIWFVSSPLSSVYYSLQKQREELMLQGLLFASRTFAVWFGGQWGGLKTTVACLAVAGVLSYGVLIRNIFGYVGGDFRRALGKVGADVWWSLAALIALIASKFAGYPPIVTATLAVLICASTTYRMLRAKDWMQEDADHQTVQITK